MNQDQYIKDISILVSLIAWEKFDYDFDMTKKYNGMSYGAAFCKEFGVNDPVLADSKERTEALEIIIVFYLKL